MTCREVTDFILDYLSGILDPEVRTRFEDHLELCAACRDYLASYRLTLEAERRAFADDDQDASVPDDLINAILDARRR